MSISGREEMCDERQRVSSLSLKVRGCLEEALLVSCEFIDSHGRRRAQRCYKERGSDRGMCGEKIRAIQRKLASDSMKRGTYGIVEWEMVRASQHASQRTSVHEPRHPDFKFAGNNPTKTRLVGAVI